MFSLYLSKIFSHYFFKDPPIPDNYKSLVLVSAKEYNKFTLLIDTDLLNNSNGPITHVGVLVTKNVPGGFVFLVLLSIKTEMYCYVVRS